MTTDEEIRRSMEAERLLNTPMLAEGFALVEKGIVDAMRQSKLGDDRTHTKLVMMLQVLGQVKGHLKTAMDTGKLARIQKESVTDKVKAFVRR